MKPLEAFQKALFFVSSICSSRTLNKPGAVINRLSSESRLALQDLKSDDIASVRTDELYGSDEYYQNKKFEEEKIEFDKKMKK